MNAKTAVPGMRTSTFVQMYRGDEMIEIEKMNRCSDCGSRKLVRDIKAGELICEICGLVLSDAHINYGPEWRAYDVFERETRSRVGAKFTWTLNDKGISTVIDMSGRDVYGRRLKEPQKHQIYRINKLHRQLNNSESAARALRGITLSITKKRMRTCLP